MTDRRIVVVAWVEVDGTRKSHSLTVKVRTDETEPHIDDINSKLQEFKEYKAKQYTLSGEIPNQTMTYNVHGPKRNIIGTEVVDAVAVSYTKAEWVRSDNMRNAAEIKPNDNYLSPYPLDNNFNVMDDSLPSSGTIVTSDPLPSECSIITSGAPPDGNYNVIDNSPTDGEDFGAASGAPLDGNSSAIDDSLADDEVPGAINAPSSDEDSQTE